MCLHNSCCFRVFVCCSLTPMAVLLSESRKSLMILQKVSPEVLNSFCHESSPIFGFLSLKLFH